MTQRLGKASIQLSEAVYIINSASIVGKKEGEGPLGLLFDMAGEDDMFGCKTWEEAESSLQKQAVYLALAKSDADASQIRYLFAGDLLNQCTGSAYGARDTEIPFVGLYGACSTMAESLVMASLFVDSGLAHTTAALTSSHFCSAERQFRFPVNYGGVRTPTAQWTATAAGCAVVSAHDQPPYVKAVTVGKIQDMGITDANNMGAAMATAAYDTISRHLANTEQSVDSFDLILTGDLGKVGSDILAELFRRDKVDITKKHNDCGLMIYDLEKQDVHAGGSGCGCSASMMCGHFLREIETGALKRVLFCATGALMSPTVVQQGTAIAGVAHAVELTSD